jgi:hypothetical protein
MPASGVNKAWSTCWGRLVAGKRSGTPKNNDSDRLVRRAARRLGEQASKERVTKYQPAMLALFNGTLVTRSSRENSIMPPSG